MRPFILTTLGIVCIAMAVLALTVIIWGAVIGRNEGAEGYVLFGAFVLGVGSSGIRLLVVARRERL